MIIKETKDKNLVLKYAYIDPILNIYPISFIENLPDNSLYYKLYSCSNNNYFVIRNRIAYHIGDDLSDDLINFLIMSNVKYLYSSVDCSFLTNSTIEALVKKSVSNNFNYSNVLITNSNKYDYENYSVINNSNFLNIPFQSYLNTVIEYRKWFNYCSYNIIVNNSIKSTLSVGYYTKINALIFAVATLKDYRNIGYASSLIKLASNYILSCNLIPVVFTENSSTLYLENGFEKYKNYYMYILN